MQLPAQGLFLAEGGGQLLFRHLVPSPPQGERCQRQDERPGRAASPQAARAWGRRVREGPYGVRATSKEDAEVHQACMGRVKNHRLELVGVPGCSPSPAWQIPPGFAPGQGDHL